MNQSENTNSNSLATTITQAVQSLGIILNTAKVYDGGHPVLQKIVADRVSEIQNAIEKSGKIKLVFDGGQILWEDTALAPGKEFFQKLSQNFEQHGIKGLQFDKNLTQYDIESLTQALQDIQERNTEKSLQTLLKEAGVKSISEIAPEEKKTGIHDKNKKEAQAGSRDTFELDLDSAIGALSLPQEDQEEEQIPQEAGEKFHGYVKQVLSDVIKDKQTVKDTSREIANQFEQQLEAEMEDYKRRTEAQIQRLESIKELVLRELEERNLAAVVVDNDLNVLAMNKQAKQLMGEITAIDPKSPLADFINSGEERSSVKINGEQYTAHLIISEGTEAINKTVLICMD